VACCGREPWRIHLRGTWDCAGVSRTRAGRRGAHTERCGREARRVSTTDAGARSHVGFTTASFAPVARRRGGHPESAAGEGRGQVRRGSDRSFERGRPRVLSSSLGLAGAGIECYNPAVTTQELYLFSCLALVITTIVAIVTRATLRRIAGASAGAAACSPIGLGIVAICERAGWWHMAISWEPHFLMLLWISVALCGYPFLITWRIARRFGGRGLGVVVGVVAVLGPFRDSWYMAKFPHWGFYAPGLAPMLAISAAYVVLGISGHGVMRLIAGPAEADRLTHRFWEQA